MLSWNRQCSHFKYITDCWLSKQVWQLAFAIIRSTTIILPAWHCPCLELNLKKRLIPYEFVTQWNLTYDMMCFILTYWKAVDQITADKVLKLRRYEIDNDDWVIIKDLVHVLEVISSVVHCSCCATYITDTFLPIEISKANLFFSQDSAAMAAMKPTQENQSLLFDDGTFLSISNCNGWVKIILELCIGLTLTFILVLHPGLKIKYSTAGLRTRMDW